MIFITINNGGILYNHMIIKVTINSTFLLKFHIFEFCILMVLRILNETLSDFKMSNQGLKKRTENIFSSDLCADFMLLVLKWFMDGWMKK